MKDERFLHQYPSRMIKAVEKFENGKVSGSDQIYSFTQFPEDIRRLNDAVQRLAAMEGREAVVNDVLEKLLTFTKGQAS
ncbi:hypothetical protein [Pseudomonas sp. BRM28]|uniref:hypothetical protein n=1 Tax=Pseudomonas sp. BRM28 TaxID=2045201 RepID=UPI000CEDE8DF|nr:hypothetical protein [Pseudomonas sp. BRM28]PPS61169.1 hypothetical protein CR917_09415 [Pseudomonas sp. BRM28]